ncbi:MAG: hypothetical protein WCB49_06765 [Gammaproteobacteria bacterium]
MKRTIFFLVLAGLFAAAIAQAAGTQLRSPELKKLDIAAGQWIFHGKSLDTPYSKAGAWTWRENCRWSPDRIYLVCTFDNSWSGQAVKSLVVDTYNTRDKSYWHYEMFSAGASGKHPFSSRMTIKGNTWVEFGEDNAKKIKERIVYAYASPTRVDVKIQVSKDGAHWSTLDKGEGIKQVRRES